VTEFMQFYKSSTVNWINVTDWPWRTVVRGQEGVDTVYLLCDWLKCTSGLEK
jgi:hypothetical protein